MTSRSWSSAPTGHEQGPTPAERALGEGRGCSATLASPSCFGFLLFVSLWLLICAWHDLAI
ncbi:hypothetical protein [Streptomyces sp. NPDC059398]|uniref:hypothetical protein n=1 Tax=Streptomyces sp. NPDC059398 TaxID=3346820 RepID=UPI0036ADD248